ncbi:MAG: 23S rRNA (adenine(2503)-C(2))-methyltransferase RlmN [Prevotellaceae bacterium]|jgi:23S rRNA (adenine2503-C2)-methyltransferase|nr:23S rRNA (adenine(2503)-C(2))-methyltransferase RlmN [Prevotellaceae bacterium]
MNDCLLPTENCLRAPAPAAPPPSEGAGGRCSFLLGKTLSELTAVAEQAGLPAFAGKQMADWLYRKKVATIAEMSNLPKAARAALSAQYEVGGFAPVKVQRSQDGVKKYLFPTLSGNFIETVMIPEAERATLCVSSQAGCRMGCRFCMTARQGFQANLSAGEIIAQFSRSEECGHLTNAVYMGMGEPLDNIDEVLKSLEILTAPWGWAWSPRRITVSTIGVLPSLRRFLDESRCHVAVSLHDPFAAGRQELMPMQKAWPLSGVIALLKQYDFSGQRRVSFEYILFAGVNDSPRHASELAGLLRGLECRVNLIRFHPIPGSPLRPAGEAQLEQFKNHLLRQGLLTTICASRGQDISAACGLLSTEGREGITKN